MGWAELFDHVTRYQHGAVRCCQAPSFDVALSTFRQRAADERWLSPFRGVRFLPGAPPTFERDVSGALLAAGERSAAGRRTAAYLHGIIDGPPRRLEIVVPYGRGVPRLGPRVHVWRSRTLLLGDVSRVRNLRVTTPRRTLCDLAAVESVGDLRGLLIDANQRRIVRYGAVLARTFGLLGSNGMPRLRQLLRELDGEGCDSVFVYLVTRALKTAGMPPDARPAAVPAAGGIVLHPDITYARYRLAIECEGFGAHSSRADLAKDVRRRNTLRSTSFDVIWVDWERYDRDLEGFLAEVRAELIARGWPPS